MLFTTLRHYLGPYRGSLLAVLVLKIVETIAVLSLPTLNADINDGVVAGDTGRIWSLGGLMLAITAVQGAVAIIGTRLSARAAMGLGRRMRRDIFIHVQRFSPEEVSRFGAPSLVTRSTNDIQQIQMVVFMVCAMMLMAPIMLMGGTFMALRVDVPLSSSRSCSSSSASSWAASCPTSGSCRSGSTASASSCASRSRACASSAPSCARGSAGACSRRPTTS